MKKRITLLSVMIMLGLVSLTACGGVLSATNSLGSHVATAPTLAAPTQVSPSQPVISSGVSGDLLAAYQEVQKLALLFPAGPLSFDQVKDAYKAAVEQYNTAMKEINAAQEG